MQIISPRRRETTVSYFHKFDYIGQTDWGFGFDCDESGLVDVDRMAEAGRENYLACLDPTNPLQVVDRGIARYEHSYTVPAQGRCQCGRIVVLDCDYRGEGIDCECGRIYNMGGQELAPRCQWEG